MDDTPWTMGQFMTGMIVALIGFIFVWKSDWFLKNFGRIPFAEKYLGTEGGTRLFYKLIGLLIMFGAFMHAVDLMEPFGAWVYKTVFSRYY